MRSASSCACSRTSSLRVLEVIARCLSDGWRNTPSPRRGGKKSTHQVGPQAVGQADRTFTAGFAEHHLRPLGNVQLRCVLQAGVEERLHTLDRALVLEKVL